MRLQVYIITYSIYSITLSTSDAICILIKCLWLNVCWENNWKFRFQNISAIRRQDLVIYNVRFQRIEKVKHHK